ncbi:response regulator [Altericroceibacterium xinjiangense]|uniref:response regulator n=1 Tax=Altericroceibacterium xinjiangense TaxID=762261 RepID=UPI000F7D5B73|nr:response regulator [Altericroceibacterium xinjiangense]
MNALAGKRVLIVEDEPIVAMMLEDMLLDLGCEVVASACQVDEALNFARTLQFDAAILDVNIHGARSYPVASALEERGLPYIFATGYGSAGIDARLRKTTVLQKPYRQAQIETALEDLLAA